MPLYLCSAPKGVVPNHAMQSLAKELTRIHCDLTSAPPTFVHVFFMEATEEGASLSPERAPVQLFGNIRSGRTDETKKELIQQMRRSVSSTLNVKISQIEMSTNDVPASWVMEGGDVLPEPGEEAAWLKAHEEKLAAADNAK